MRSPNAKRDWSLDEKAEPGHLKASSPLQLIRRAAHRLRSAGIEAPQLTAERLLAHLLETERSSLYRDPRPLSPLTTAKFAEFVARRCRREPLQHLVGKTEFWSLTILCDERALIPRPETELCVRAALDFIADVATPVVYDVATGTGCVAIALAHERPDARIFASDISADALALAGENLRLHGLQKQIRLLQGDLGQAFPETTLASPADLVVCNPPYVAEAEIPTLQPEVRDHDPHPALCAGPDGLLFYRRLLREFPSLLRRNGGLVLELGEGQARDVCDLARDSGWHSVQLIKDAARIDRVLVANRIYHG